jgi:DNA-binding NtrC family response regulator
MREAKRARRSAGSRELVQCQLEQLIVGPSAALNALRQEIEALADAPLRSVLVLGETGVGKDLVARALQLCAPSPAGPLEVFNCPAVPSDHLEAELFGTARGAYPGALDRPGAVERADGGILLLDEVGSMPAVHQAKLLRLLENAEARRLGGRCTYPLRLQVVASTNEDLHRAIAQGRFRQDLYYRLVQDGVLRIPPLRERREDIEPLAALFLAELGRPPRLGADVLAQLRSHIWMGNVRELRAVVRSASHLAGHKEIGGDDVAMAVARMGPTAPEWRADPAVHGSDEGAGFHGRTLVMRRQLLVDALRASAGNRTRAGILLGLHRRRDEPAALGEPSELGLAARKRAHRKFDYWWRRLVESSPESPRVDPDAASSL